MAWPIIIYVLYGLVCACAMLGSDNDRHPIERTWFVVGLIFMWPLIVLGSLDALGSERRESVRLGEQLEATQERLRENRGELHDARLALAECTEEMGALNLKRMKGEA